MSSKPKRIKYNLFLSSVENFIAIKYVSLMFVASDRILNSSTDTIPSLFFEGASKLAKKFFLTNLISSLKTAPNLMNFFMRKKIMTNQ